MSHTLKDYTFVPDTHTTFDNGKSRSVVLAESISMCGKCIVVTSCELEDKSVSYGLTHTLTGASLTGRHHNKNITFLKRAAREFWRDLPANVKKVLQTCDDSKECIEAIRPYVGRHLSRLRSSV